MNGRVYDYNLGRFISVDPFIQDPGNSQSMNPYSYIMNNPLAGTDPSGYWGVAASPNENKCMTVACDIGVMMAGFTTADNGRQSPAERKAAFDQQFNSILSVKDRKGKEWQENRVLYSGYIVITQVSGATDSNQFSPSQTNVANPKSREAQQPRAISLDQDRYRGNINAAQNRLTYLNNLIGNKSINQPSLRNAISDLNWHIDMAMHTQNRNKYESQVMRTVGANQDSLSNGGLLNLMGHVYGEAAQDVIKYSPTILAARGFWIAAAAASNIGTSFSVYNDVENGDYGKGSSRVIISTLVKRFAEDAALTTPGGRAFGSFFYGSEALLGSLTDERK